MKTKYSKVFDEVLKQIKPKNNIHDKVQNTINLLQKSIDEHEVDAIIKLGGSFSKDTYLEGDFDCDLFVRFNFEKYKNENISKILEKCIPFKFQKVHGSRDYFQTLIENINYEIVPVLKIENLSQAKNVTDSSPLHVDWFMKANNKRYNDDIRLAKYFCKANRLYGAESHIKGFSGHVLDILTINYKGFENLLKASLEWKEGDVIDVSNHFNNKLNESKVSPLIVIDPIQSERNASAALSKKKFEEFKKQAKAFLENPSIDFFKKKAIDEKALKQKGTLYKIKITPVKGKKDIVGSKVLKVYDYIATQAKLNDFKIDAKDWEFDLNTSYLYYVLKETTLEKDKVVKGPPLKVKSHAQNFLQTHKNTFEKDGFVYATITRKYLSFITFINDILQDSYITEKVKSIEVVKSD